MYMILAHLILGDSHARRLNQRRVKECSGLDTYVDGRSGATSADILEAVQRSPVIMCDTVTLVIGSNDISQAIFKKQK